MYLKEMFFSLWYIFTKVTKVKRFCKYFFVMAQFISSVFVVLSPKERNSSDPFLSKVINLDVVTGSTVSLAVHFISKHPLIKPYLSKYNILSFVFKYSEL